MSMTEAQWATLVLQDASIQPSTQNVTDMLQWMTAEEPTSNWFDRNNPLNTGKDTSSVDGTGSYADLTVGAQETAATINQTNMSGIRAALQASDPLTTFDQALQASPWASSHYPTISGVPAPDGSTPAPANRVGSAQVLGVPAGVGNATATDTGIIGNIAGGAAGAVAGPILSFIDTWAIRAGLFLFGAIAIIIGLVKLTDGSSKAKPAQGSQEPSEGEEPSSGASGREKGTQGPQRSNQGRPGPGRSGSSPSSGARGAAPQSTGAAADVESTVGDAVAAG